MSALGAHLREQYANSVFTDATIVVRGCSRQFKAVLSQSQFFRVLMSEWDGDSANEVADVVEFHGHVGSVTTPDSAADELEAAIRFLYGHSPLVTRDTVPTLLSAGAYFDVPELLSLVSEFVFRDLRHDTAVGHLLRVLGREYGEPGAQIERAALAFLYRNAVDICAPELARLPLAAQRQLLTAPELYVADEHARYALAVAMLRAGRAAMRGGCCPASLGGAACEAKEGCRCTSGVARPYLGDAGLESPPPRTTTTARRHTAAACRKSLPVDDVWNRDGSLSSFSVAAEAAAAAASDVNADVDARELEATYAGIFASIRFVHFTRAQLAAAAADAVVGAAALETAAAVQDATAAALAAAALRRAAWLSESSCGHSAAEAPPPWPPYRFGVEVTGAVAEWPLTDAAGAPATRSSGSVAFGGSRWCLDLKCFVEPTGGAEFVAVYLRRRARGGDDGSGSLTADPHNGRRADVIAGFSIRLCGAPGAPTSNSVCGRSVAGKTFGADGSSSASWGWAAFLPRTALCARPWATGDVLRFVVEVSLL